MVCDPVSLILIFISIAKFCNLINITQQERMAIANFLIPRVARKRASFEAACELRR
jgi:hypothetical protein